MVVSLESLGIDKLSAADRLLLMHQIWNSLADQPEAVAITDAQQAELRRRLKEHQTSPDDVVSWEEVEARLLADGR